MRERAEKLGIVNLSGLEMLAGIFEIHVYCRNFSSHLTPYAPIPSHRHWLTTIHDHKKDQRYQMGVCENER